MDFKTAPKEFTDVDGLVYSITTLRGKLVYFPLTLDAERFPFKLYIEFVDSTGRERGEKNAERDDVEKTIALALRAQNPELSQEDAALLARQACNELISGLLVGTNAQRLAAASQLAGSYGYQLLALEEQWTNPTTEFPDLQLEKHIPGTAVEKTTRFRLIRGCRFTHQGRTFEIPAGFKTDFSSVPRIVWPVLPPHGLSARASVKHDFLYDYRILDQELGPAAARHAADRAFLLDMLTDHVPFWQALVMYGAVRLFGRAFWVN